VGGFFSNQLIIIIPNYPAWTSQNQKDPGPLITRIKQITLIINSRILNN